MRAILVAGGAGYVGAQCCKALAEAGYLPVVFDNLSMGHRDFVRWGPLVQADIRDRAAVLDALDRHKPEAVMHFAAKSLVGESVEKPDLYYENNVLGTLVLLQAMRDRGLDKIVFSSTCAIYGDQVPDLITEATPKNPVSPYGSSKLTCETMMEEFGRAFGLRSVRLRYFNACGADPAGHVGEDHAPETHLIPIALDVVLGRRGTLKVFGSDYPTTDGSAVRDYIHVVDLASAHLKALEALRSGEPSAALNLGTGRGHSVLEVIKAVEAVTGRPLAVEMGPRRAGDAPSLVANPALAQSRLGWRPERSGIRQIVSDAWAWHQLRFGSAPGV